MKQSAKQKEWKQAHYRAMKGLYQERDRLRREHFKAIIRESKNRPCADCLKSYPYFVMDFDHVRGDKLFEISELPNISSEKVLLEEIEKCDVVCANCHRIRTFQDVA